MVGIKIAINKCFGGFGVTEEVIREAGLGDMPWLTNSNFDISSNNCEAWRADPRLIAAIEKIGVEKAGDHYAALKIVTIPEGVNWRIAEYDGMEHIYEVHREWS